MKNHILVVDDQKEMFDIICHLFAKDQDYVISYASHGLEAKEKITKQEYELDLLLLDLKMPEMGGEALLEWTRLSHSGYFPIVVITAYPQLGSPQKFMRYGVWSYVVKGTEQSRSANLKKLILEALKEQRYRKDDIRKKINKLVNRDLYRISSAKLITTMKALPPSERIDAILAAVTNMSSEAIEELQYALEEKKVAALEAEKEYEFLLEEDKIRAAKNKIPLLFLTTAKFILPRFIPYKKGVKRNSINGPFYYFRYRKPIKVTESKNQELDTYMSQKTVQNEMYINQETLIAMFQDLAQSRESIVLQIKNRLFQSFLAVTKREDLVQVRQKLLSMGLELGIEEEELKNIETNGIKEIVEIRTLLVEKYLTEAQKQEFVMQGLLDPPSEPTLPAQQQIEKKISENKLPQKQHIVKKLGWERR